METATTAAGPDIDLRPYDGILSLEAADRLAGFHTLGSLQERGCILRYTD